MNSIPGLTEFLAAYPGMSVRPSQSSETIIQGVFGFSAAAGGKQVTDSFDLEVTVPPGFPQEIPKVREIGGRIPRTSEYHINPNPDCTLCLGSHLRLKQFLTEHPSLVRFAEVHIVGFLFNAAIKLRDGGDFVAGELLHGTDGIVQDYNELFGLPTKEQVLQVLELLSIKKRIANKKPCPCLCGKRLGRCRLRHVLNKYRRAAPRSWFSQHKDDIVRKEFG